MDIIVIIFIVVDIIWGIGRAATLLKTLLQYYGKFLARCCLPRSPGQPQHHKYQNWI